MRRAARRVSWLLVVALGALPGLARPADLPDLIVQRIEFVDCAPRVGVTLYNQGPVSAQGAFDVRLSALAPGQPTSEAVQVLGGLGAFSTARLLFELAPMESFAVQVDANHAIRESHEGNNRIESTVRQLVRCPSVSIASASAVEGQPVRFPVRISHVFNQPVRITFVAEDGEAEGVSFGLMNSAGDATCGADFIRSLNEIEFPAGTTQLEQFVSVPTCRDGVAEGMETFELRISEVLNAMADTNHASGTGTIRDQSPVR